MRIITIEEHAFDPDLAQATEAAQAASGGFLRTLATEDPKPGPDIAGRPAMRPMREVRPLEADLGDGRIAEMDAHGIGMQVLSYSRPTQLVPAGAAVGLARAANDRLAAAVRAHPDRFAGFATLPWQDPQAAAAELERSVKELGLKGTLLIGRPGSTFLDDERYRPVLATLEALRVPLYIHPGAPLPQVQQPYYDGFSESVTPRGAGRGPDHPLGGLPLPDQRRRPGVPPGPSRQRRGQGEDRAPQRGDPAGAVARRSPAAPVGGAAVRTARPWARCGSELTSRRGPEVRLRPEAVQAGGRHGMASNVSDHALSRSPVRCC